MKKFKVDNLQGKAIECFIKKENDNYFIIYGEQEQEVALLGTRAKWEINSLRKVDKIIFRLKRNQFLSIETDPDAYFYDILVEQGIIEFVCKITLKYGLTYMLFKFTKEARKYFKKNKKA